MRINENRRERRLVHLIALLTASMGIVNLISAVQPALMKRFVIIETIFSLEFSHGSRITTVLAGFAFLLVASNLWRRKRAAWLMTAFLLVVSLLSHLFKGLDFEEASLSLGLLILLVVMRHSFHAESDRPSVRHGLLTLAAASGFTFIYGTIGIFLLDQHFSSNFSFWEAINQIVVLFTTFSNPGLVAVTGFGRYFVDSIFIIGLITISFALLMLIRPVVVRESATAEERAHAKAIIKNYGRTSLAHATLFDDKSYFFFSEETVISYAVAGRGAIVLGDPIGPPKQIVATINAFQDFCTRKDWTPSFVSVLPDYLSEYKIAGFDVVCIGYEAIVNLEEFNLEGSANKGIRNTVSKLERLGYRTKVHLAPLQDNLLRSLHEISDAWLTSQHGGEMHFSDGWFEERYLRNEMVMVVYTADGIPIAFANLVPEYQKNELTIDLMRHFYKIENGTMEFLFTKMLHWAKVNGYASFSLGLSAIVGVGEKPDDPRVEQVLHTIAEYVSRFYNFKGLHNFKEKFHPYWEPRYLVYSGTTSLPLVMDSLLRVHAGKNYIWSFLGKKNHFLRR